MHADHFDIFPDTDHDDEHGGTPDYWDAYEAALASIGFALLTDEELDTLDSDADADDDMQSYWHEEPDAAAIFFGYNTSEFDADELPF